MAITLTQVTGAVALPNGETPDNGSIVFQLQTWDKEGVTLFLNAPVVTMIAANGTIDVSLQATDETEAEFTYAVTVRYFSQFRQAMIELRLPNIAVPSSGPVVLADLLSLPAPTPDVPDIVAQAFAAAARAKASAQGMVDNSSAAAASATSAAISAQTATDKATAAAASAKQAADTASSVGIVIPTQAEAEAGTDNGKLMTPLRTLQSFVKNYNDRVATAAQVIAGTATNLYVTPATLLAWLTDRLATQAEAEAGTATGKLMTPQRVAQYVAIWFTGKIATTAQAASGTDNARIMTPLAAEQHMLANAMGWGQTRSAFTAAQRPSNTVQTNDTGRPIEVTVMAEGGGAIFETSADGTTFVIAAKGFTISSADRLLATVTVPAGHRYRVTYGALFSWSELR